MFVIIQKGMKQFQISDQVVNMEIMKCELTRQLTQCILHTSIMSDLTVY